MERATNITQEHLDTNPDLNEDYRVGDAINWGAEGEQRRGGCDKSNPSDPHHGQAGDYDADCNWIPDIGEQFPEDDKG